MQEKQRRKNGKQTTKNIKKSKNKNEKQKKQAGAELGQAQLPTGIWLYCDFNYI